MSAMEVDIEMGDCTINDRKMTEILQYYSHVRVFDIDVKRLKSYQLFYTEDFIFGHNTWKLRIYPGGYQNESLDNLSIFIEVVDSDMLPEDWFREVEYGMFIFGEDHILSEASYTLFSESNYCNGFVSFLPENRNDNALQKLLENNFGYVNDGIIKIGCAINLYDWRHSNYDLEIKREENGIVGLKNQGATCYLNSLLQSLYHIPKFRDCLFKIDTLDVPILNSVPKALQYIFYKLGSSDYHVGTEVLTRSFGWDRNQAFIQQDVQEVLRKLISKLEEEIADDIQNLFQGVVYDFIECVNVEYTRIRHEKFYDIQLTVQNTKNIYESLDKYCTAELLTGDNKYQTQDHGLQEAKKGMRFHLLPPVLFFNLKRYEYTLDGRVIKINSEFSFDFTLNLDKYMSPDSPKTEENNYILYAVYVHLGSVTSGHYYLYINYKNNIWIKLNDSFVTEVEEDEVLNTFGGNETAGNAYMLIYIKEDKLEFILDQGDTNEELKEQFDNFKLEEQSDYLINIFLERDFHDHPYYELTGNQCTTFTMKKTDIFSSLVSTISKQLDISESKIRFWHWCSRKNGTKRPLTTIQRKKYDQELRYLRQNNGALSLFVEELIEPTPALIDDTILIFIKSYQPGKLRYRGKFFFSKKDKLERILTTLKEIAGIHPGESVRIWEEINLDNLLELTDYKKCTLGELGSISGDIFIVQSAGERLSPYATALDYFEKYLAKLSHFSFNPYSENEHGYYEILLSPFVSIDEVTEQLRKKIQTNHRIVLYSSYCENMIAFDLSDYSNLYEVLQETGSPHLYYKIE